MSPDTITWLCLLGGIILLASELFLPGLVAMFLGLGAGGEIGETGLAGAK